MNRNQTCSFKDAPKSGAQLSLYHQNYVLSYLTRRLGSIKNRVILFLLFGLSTPYIFSQSIVNVRVNFSFIAITSPTNLEIEIDGVSIGDNFVSHSDPNVNPGIGVDIRMDEEAYYFYADKDYISVVIKVNGGIEYYNDFSINECSNEYNPELYNGSTLSVYYSRTPAVDILNSLDKENRLYSEGESMTVSYSCSYPAACNFSAYPAQVEIGLYNGSGADEWIPIHYFGANSSGAETVVPSGQIQMVLDHRDWWNKQLVVRINTPDPMNGSEHPTEPILFRFLPKIKAGTSHTEPTCFGGDDGTITVTITNDNLPSNSNYNINLIGQESTIIPDPSGTTVITKLTSGDYQLQIIAPTESGFASSDVYNIHIPNPEKPSTSIGYKETYGTHHIRSCDNQGILTSTLQEGKIYSGSSWLGDINQGLCSIENPTSEDIPIVVKTDAECLVTNSGLTTINFNPTPPISLNLDLASKKNISCLNSTDGQVNYSYGTNQAGYGTKKFYVNDSDADFGISGNTITGLSARLNTIKVVDEAGCSDSKDVTILAPSSELIINPTTSEAPKCSDLLGKITLNPTGGWGGFSYKQIGGTLQNDNSFSLVPGTYNFTVQDAGGCSKDINNVVINPAPTLTISTSNFLPTSCQNADNGQIDLTLGGGTGNVNYSITGNNYSKSGSFSSNTTVTLDNLMVGTYTVSLKDANDCLQSGTFDITPTTNPISISSGIDLVEAATCRQISDGVANITVLGGGRPAMDYSLWDGNKWRPFTSGKDTANIRRLSAGNNIIRVKDAENCEASIPYNVPMKQNRFRIEAFTTDATCNQVADGSVMVQRKPGTGVVGDIDFSFNTSTIKSSNPVNFYNISTSPSQYHAIGTNVDGCIDTAYFYITPSSSALKLSTPVIISDAACARNGTGIVNVKRNAGTGVGNVYYSLPDSTPKLGPSEVNFYNLEPRNYKVIAIDTKGCKDSIDFTIGVRSDSLNFKPYVFKNAACTNSPSGIIVGTSKVNKVKTGWGSVTYSLQSQNKSSKDTVLFERLIQGNYILIAQDSVGCKMQVSVNVIDLPNSVHFTTPVKKQQSCTEVKNGSIQIGATSSSDIKKFKFYNRTEQDTSDWEASVAYEGLEGKSYLLTVVDTNRCSRDTVVTIINKNNNPILKISSIDSLYCSNDQTGVIRFKISQKERRPVYKFYLNGVLNADSIFINRSSKKDTILVVDLDGCSGDTIMGVPVLTNTIRFSPIPSFTHASCAAAKNGTITVKAVNGFPFAGGNYKYSINTGEIITAKDAVFDSLEANKDYVVSVLDSKNCLINYENKIPIRVINDTLSLDIPKTTDATCFEKATGRMVVTRTNGTPFRNGFKYSIIDSTGTTISTQEEGSNSVQFAGLKYGKYTVVVNDTNKCSVSQPFIVGYVPLFDVNSITPTRVRKYGTKTGAIRAIASGGNRNFNYKAFRVFETEPFQTGTNKDTINIRELRAGTYAIYIQDTARCIVDKISGSEWFKDTVVIAQPSSALALQIANQKNVACYGDSSASVQLLTVGGYPQYWYAINDKVNFQREPLFGNLPKGSYEFFVRDDAGIDTSIVIEIIQPSSPLTPSLAGTNRTSCYNYANGKASLNITGGTSPYFVSLDSVNWQSDLVLVGLKADNYRALVRDANNCFAPLANIVVNQPDSIAVSSQSITNTPCLKNEGAINVTGVTGGNGGYSYVWYKKDSVIGSQPTLSDLFSGRYKLRITDKDGCKGDTAFFVSDISNIWVNFTTTPIDCWGKANGKAELTVVKGALPLTEVQWPGKPLSLFATAELDSGVHRVVIVDNQRCQKDTTFTINTISRIAIPEVWRNNPLCLGRSDGSLNVEASGGNPGYTYNWGKYGSGNEITNLLPGIYNVSVTDANNCVRAFDFTLDYQKTEKPLLGKDLVLCSKSDYILSPGNYLNYNWILNNKPESTDSVLVVRQPGTYIVNVESDEQCVGSDTLKVDFSTEEMLSDFLMTTQAYVGDTIMLVEISRPLPDSVTWILSSGSKLIDYGQYFKQIALTDTGIYKYALIAHYKGCSDMVEKYVEVIPSDGSNSKKKSAMDDLFKSVSLYPNPTSGEFTAEILLQRKSDLLMKIVNLGTGITEYIRSSKGSDIYTENFSLKLMPGIHVLYLQAGNSSRTVNIMVR